MSRAHDHHIAEFCLGSGHLSWCSRGRCFRDENGVWVHEQEPVCWEGGEVLFESWLLLPEEERPPVTYLYLGLKDLRLTWCHIDAFLPIATARRLRDQLSAHLSLLEVTGRPPTSA